MSRSATNNHAFLYDLDDNQSGWNATDSTQNRGMVWDEDNRLKPTIPGGRRHSNRPQFHS